jgi:hypothetical protein
MFTIFGVVMLCELQVETNISEENTASIFRDSVCSSETMASTKTTWSYNPEDKY